MDKNCSEHVKLINESLYYYINKCCVLDKKLLESVKYSLFAVSKLIRPLLVLDFCHLCNGNVQLALPLAVSVEMVHTYSLIHDDLPCMDNDSVRRGKPSNHIANGENFALLSGDALLSLAFEVLSLDETVKLLGESLAVKAVKVLSSSSGISSMIDGQAMDISYKSGSLEFNSSTEHFEYLKNIYLKKTGKLIGASCALGCVAAGASDSKIFSAKMFGESIGVAYQILDDLEDKDLESGDFFYSEFSNKLFAKNVAKSLIRESLEILYNEFNISDDKLCFAKKLATKLSKCLETV